MENTLEQRKLVKQFIAWIYKLAYKYVNIGTHYLDVQDLVSIGSMAIFEAVERYDPKNKAGAKLNSYIMSHSRWRMLTEIRNCSKMNASQENAMIMLRSFLRDFEHLNRLPTPEELSVYCQKRYSKTSTYYWSPKTAEIYLTLYRNKTISLDTIKKNDSDNESSFFNKCEPVANVDIENTQIESEEKRLLYQAISELKEQYRIVMIGRIRDEKTLEEIGNELHLTPERIRQIESAATKIIEKKIRNYISRKIVSLKRSIYKPKLTPPSMEKKAVHTFYKEHGDMIFPEEYTLSPMCFKILQFLKTNPMTSKTKLAESVDCTVKTIYNCLDILYDINYINEDNEVLPRSEWYDPVAVKKMNSEPIKPVAHYCDPQPETRPTMEFREPKPVLIPPTPKMYGNQLESLCGKFYTITEDLGGRYEVFDPSIGKYTIIKENEVKRIF